MPKKIKKLGVVMDEITSINISKDSTFAMLLEAQNRNIEIFYMLLDDLSIINGEAIAMTRTISINENNDEWWNFESENRIPLSNLDAILMRKDPPFDMEYIYATYILSLAETKGTKIINKPQSLRNMNEKAYISWFPQCAPPTIVTRSIKDIRTFLNEHHKIVVKPLDGMGGKSIFVVDEKDNNANVIFETITDSEAKYAMIQSYIPDIKKGDKRILIIDGKPFPYSLARIPPPDDNRGNLVAGAIGKGQKLSSRDLWICEEIGSTLKENGVIFAGIDVIGDYLTEVNVTSPTGIRELDKIYESNIAALLLDAIEEN